MTEYRVKRTTTIDEVIYIEAKDEEEAEFLAEVTPVEKWEKNYGTEKIEVEEA